MITAAPEPIPATPAVHVPVPPAVAPQLDAEKLDCYRVALEAHTQATALVPSDYRVLRDQLERASLSA